MKIYSSIVIATALVFSVPNAVTAKEDTAKTHVSHHDAKFIREAAEGNNAEIGLAELAKRKSADPQVKHYAEMLIRDHEQSNRELEPIAAARGIEWPVPVKKSDARELERAGNMNPQEFDRMAINHWIKDHKADIKEFDKAAKHATDPQVKQFALSSLPTLRQHLAAAQNISSAGAIHEPAGSRYAP